MVNLVRPLETAQLMSNLDGVAPLSIDLPRHPVVAHRCSEPLAKPLFDHRLPRYQREALSIVEHGVASTGEHATAPVDGGHLLPVGHRPMLQPGLVGNTSCSLCQVASSQRCQQIACENET